MAECPKCGDGSNGRPWCDTSHTCGECLLFGNGCQEKDVHPLAYGCIQWTSRRD